MSSKAKKRKRTEVCFVLAQGVLLCTAVMYAVAIGIQMKMVNVVGYDSFFLANDKRHRRQQPGQVALQEKERSWRGVDKGVAKRPINGEESEYRRIAAEIAAKWNLTTPNGVELLEDQFYKENDYDPEKDFFHFHHLYKSGGTSISTFLDRTIGLPDENGVFQRILPGSYQSGNFNHAEALAAIQKHVEGGTPEEDLPYRASYAHTGLRPVHGPKQTETGKFLLAHFPHKRLRAIAMLRDPTDFRASNHAMIMCGLNARVVKWNKQRAERGLPQACSPQQGLNISALVDLGIEELLDKCRTSEQLEAQGQKAIVNKYQRKACKDQLNGIDTQNHCRSAAHLLASPKYDKHYRSMFKGLMGRFHRGQSFGGTAVGRMNYGYTRAEESKGYTLQAVEEYTLQDLGGLDTTISGAGDGVGPPEPDFIWFGITERMTESICLFYYYFRVGPIKKIPISRVQNCRPTSWWTQQDRETVKAREPADYAVWRAANAIMDVRLRKMRMEIQTRIDAGETEEDMPYVASGCFNDTFGSVGQGPY